MAIQYSQQMRADAKEQNSAFANGSGWIRIFAGTMPAGCSVADAGTMLCQITTGPAAFEENNTIGGVSLVSVLTGQCVAAGTATYFRIYTSGGTCKAQGPIGANGLALTDTSLVVGQTVRITQFSLASGNPAPGIAAMSTNLLEYDVATHNTVLDMIEDYHRGVGTMTFRVFTGSPPTTLEAAATGTLIGSFTYSSADLLTISNGVGTLTAPFEFTAVASGTIGYFRIGPSTDLSESNIQGTVGAAGSGADIEMPGSAAVFAGQQIKLVTFSINKTGLI